MVGILTVHEELCVISLAAQEKEALTRAVVGPTELVPRREDGIFDERPGEIAPIVIVLTDDYASGDDSGLHRISVRSVVLTADAKRWYSCYYPRRIARQTSGGGL